MNESKRLDFPSAKRRLERVLLAIESNTRTPEELEAIFRARAEMLSQPLQSETDEAGEEIVIFRLGTGRYAVPLAGVSEVTARPRIAPAPGAPEEIAGLMQVRGEIRVVWNLRRLLGLDPPLEHGEDSTALLLRTVKGEIALLVGEIEDIRNVYTAERRPAPEDSIAGTWMTNDLVVVLDTEGLLPLEGKTQH